MANGGKESLGRTLGVNVLLLVLGLGAAYGLYAGLQLGYSTDAPIRVVVSGSMIPKYNINDMVVVKGVGTQIVPILYVFNVPVEGVNVASLKAGDDIIFLCIGPSARCPYYDTITDPIVHEIIGTTANSSMCGGDTQLTTHGINNPAGSNEHPCASDVIGLVTGSVPYVGYASEFLRSGLGIMLILLLIGILFAVELLEPTRED